MMLLGGGGVKWERVMEGGSEEGGREGGRGGREGRGEGGRDRGEESDKHEAIGWKGRAMACEMLIPSKYF